MIYIARCDANNGNLLGKWISSPCIKYYAKPNIDSADLKNGSGMVIKRDKTLINYDIKVELQNTSKEILDVLEKRNDFLMLIYVGANEYNFFAPGQISGGTNYNSERVGFTFSTTKNDGAITVQLPDEVVLDKPVIIPAGEQMTKLPKIV
jgi:hypothetical protein